jgi:hypothetical protein
MPRKWFQTKNQQGFQSRKNALFAVGQDGGWTQWELIHTDATNARIQKKPTISLTLTKWFPHHELMPLVSDTMTAKPQTGYITQSQ